MRKSTLRIIKAIGIVAFVFLFGVFIYLFYKTQFVVENMGLVSVRSNDHGEGIGSEPDRPVGFDYAGRS